MLHIKLEDYKTSMIIFRFDNAIRFIDYNLEKGRKVLVHCYAGISRSPTIVIAYIMYKMKMSYRDAYDFVYDKRWIQPNSSFVEQLKLYENHILSGKRLFFS